MTLKIPCAEREVDVETPPGWEPTPAIGHEDGPNTVYTNDNGWFDIVVRKTDTEDKYEVSARRGPNHPHQGDLGDSLRTQASVPGNRLEYVIIGFMMTASDIDPFTNRFTRGKRVTDEQSAEA